MDFILQGKQEFEYILNKIPNAYMKRHWKIDKIKTMT
jgi:hypothetical protein